MKNLLAIALIAFCIDIYAHEDVEDASIMQLIVTPEKFSGKKVNISGYAVFGFENNLISFHRDDYKYLISQNSLWLNVNKEKIGDLKKYSNSYVRIIGTFNTKDKGHMDLFSGSIEVDRIQLIKPLALQDEREK